MPSGPKFGELYLHCGHDVLSTDSHYWNANELEFAFADYKEGKLGTPIHLTAQWIVQCEDCNSKLPRKPKPENFMIRGHDIWIGNEPVIKNPVHEQN